MKRVRWELILYGAVMLVLLALAVWQLSSYLGLRISRGHSRILSVTSTQNREKEAGILCPLRMYISSGEQEGRGSLVSDQTAHYETLYEDSWNFLQAILTQDTETRSMEIASIERTESVCSYSYALELNTAMLSERTGWYYSGDFSFQEIWMIPAQSVRENARIYLLNGRTGKALEIHSSGVQWQSETNLRLLERMNSLCLILGEKYIASSYAYPGYFKHNLYLRDQNEPEMLVPWRLKAPIEFTEELCRAEVEHFFEYPEWIKGESYDEDAWIFADDQCSVRIRRNGVTDYVKTYSSADTESVTVGAAYDTAYDFLQEDLEQDEIRMGIYLCEIEQTEKGYRFCWNYKWDDRMVLPDPEVLNMENMRSAIEIEVVGSEVYRYRRWRIQPEYSLYRTQALSDTVLDAMDRVERRAWDGVRMLYRIEGSEAVLYWELESDGQKIYEKVLQR